MSFNATPPRLAADNVNLKNFQHCPLAVLLFDYSIVPIVRRHKTDSNMLFPSTGASLAQPIGSSPKDDLREAMVYTGDRLALCGLMLYS